MRSGQLLGPSSGGTISSAGLSAAANRRSRCQQQRIGFAIGTDPRTVNAAIGLHHHRRCRARQRHGCQIERSPAQSVRFQGQLVDHSGGHLMQQVGAGGDAEARRELARHRRSAHAVGRFQHQHPVTGAGQVAGADQAVVTAADDDRVVVRILARRVVHAGSAMRRSRSTARAAFAPGAPMTPPPGCVLEPHRYSPPSGVRYCAQPGMGRLNSSWSKVSSPWKILPSVSPTSASRSCGVRTSACRIRLLKSGLWRAMVSMTVSPKALRLAASQGPLASL